MRKLLPIILVFAVLCTCLIACQGNASKQPSAEDPRFTELPVLPLSLYHGENSISVGHGTQHTDQEEYRLWIPEERDGLPVISITERGFAYSFELVVAKIPGSIKWIDQWAFLGCPGLEIVKMEHGVEIIGPAAFADCPALTEVTMPNSLTELSYTVFTGCTSLTEITYTGTCAEWNTLEKDEKWNAGSAIKVVHCTDGDIAVGE